MDKTIKWTPEYTKLYLKEWRKKHPNYSKIRYDTKIKPNKEKYNKLYKRNLKNETLRKKKYRNEIIQTLGFKCKDCGFDDIRALQIDHVYGGGRKEYRTAGRNNSKYYKQILEKIKSGSDEYQLLCSNCNWIKRYEKNEDSHSAEIIGVASGYFNPLHIGHIEYLNKSRILCDKLIVIINNDKQVKIKGSIPFMNENERIEIIKNLKCVDKIFLSIDKDASVCKSLEKLKPNLFLKGGDKNKTNIPEKQICDNYNIKIIDGLGKKIQSSSCLIKKEDMVR